MFGQIQRIRLVRQARVKTREQIREANKSRTEEGQNPTRQWEAISWKAGMDGELGRITRQGNKAQTKGIRSGQTLGAGGPTAGNKKHNMGLDM